MSDRILRGILFIVIQNEKRRSYELNETYRLISIQSHMSNNVLHHENMVFSFTTAI